MKKLKLVYLLFFLLLNIILNVAFNASAQGQSITLKMKRPPLNQLSVADLYNIDLTNNTSERVEFYLYGTLNESKAGLIATATTVSIVLGPKERKQFKASDLPGTPDISYPSSDNRYKDALMRKGSLPDGNYTICVYARQIGTNDELANDCIEQEISIQSETQITLLTPDNKSKVDVNEPLLFSWFLPIPATSGQTYKIKIIELKGDESPENAMLKNKAFFEKEEIRTATFQYPSSAPKLEVGKSYAWQVSTKDAKSEIFRFSQTGDGKNSRDLTDSCINNTVNISTGWDHNTNQTYNNLGIDQDVFWTLIAAPTNSGTVNIGGPVWVIEKHPAWQPPGSGSQWISAFQTSGSNEANMNASFSPYIYRKIICVQALSDLDFAMQVLVDNKADINFVDASGNLIDNIGTATGFGTPTQLTKVIPNVAAGNYFLQIEHRNDNGGSPMGVNLQGTVTSNTAVFNNIICCNPPGSTITGYKFHDINNNGIKDNADSVMQGWTIELSGNGLSQTSVTDGNGNYLFTNLPQGTYTITENMQSGWTAGVTGYQQTVTVGANTSVNDIFFGNIKSTDSCALCNSDFEESPQVADSNYIQVSEDEIPCWETTASDNKIEIWSSGMHGIPAFSGNQFAELNCTQVGTLYQTFSITSPITQTIYFAHRGRYAAPDVMNVSVGPVGGPYTVLGTYTDNNSAWSYYSVSHTFATAGNYEIRFESVSSNGGNGPNAGGNFLDAISVGCPTANQPVETGNACDSLTAAVQAGSGDCCWSISLINNQSELGINGVQFLTQAPITFSGYPSTPSNTQWQYQSSSPLDLSLVNVTGGYLTQGQTNNFINFCLNNYTTSPQLVIVNWKHNDSIVCTDTLKLNCQKECMELNVDSVYCYNDGYNINFSFLNQSGFDIHTLEITPVTPNTTIAPAAITLSPDVATGSNSWIQTVFAASTDDVTEICFIVKAIGPENCCFCIDTICVPVQSCVCSDIDASISGSGPGCCWDVTLNNNYLPNYFTGVSLNILTSGVTFAGTITAPTGWMLNNASPFTTLRYKPLPWTNGGKIPSGAISPLHFCLAGYTSAPTVIVLNWLAGQNGDSVVCTDTLEVSCTPDPVNNGCLGIFNDSLWCNADGTFGYEFQVFNAIYGFTAEGFALSPLPVGSAAFNPAVFPGLNLPPLTNSGVLSSTISGVNSGEELCFRTTMYDSIFSENNQTWSTLCCHFDTCYTMPDCGTVIIDSCNCKGGRWNSSTIGVSINNGHPSKYSCGEQITADLNSNVNLNFPTFTCSPASCPAVYRWELSDASGNIQSTGTTNLFNQTFNTPGNYLISYIASCNGIACDTCTLRVIVKNDGGDNCKCDEKASFEVSYEPGLKEKVGCGKTISAQYGANLTFTPNSLCIPKDCLTGYSYEIFDMQTNVFVSGQNISGNNPFTFALNSSAGYTIKINYNCGGKRCECIIYVRTKPVEQGCDCKRGKWDLSKSAIKYTVDGKPNEKRIKCDGNYEIDGNTTVSLSPEYNCGQANCNAKYTYKVNNGAMTGFQSSPYNISNINSPSSVTIYAWCGEKICDSCTIYLKPRINTGCKCGKWNEDKPGITIHGFNGNPKEEIEEFIKCDDIYKSIVRTSYMDLVSQTYLCLPGDCKAVYEWVITSPNGTTSSFGTQVINSFQFNQKGTYSIQLRVFCGGVQCGQCKIQINVKAHPNDPK